MRCFIWLATAAALMLVGCGKDKSTQPPVQQGTLLLSRLSVAVVPGGSETITVWAAEANGSPDECSITCSDASVATATISDSTISITGIGYGTANVVVTSSGGPSRTIPVQVYDPFIVDTGELLVTFVDTFTFIWGPPPPTLSFHQPVAPEGFRAVGSLCMAVPNNSDPNGKYAMMVVKAKDGSDALAEPIGYEYVMNLCVPECVSIWTPIPPEGYVALGSVAYPGNHISPPLDYVVCVREDLTIDGEAGAVYYQGYGIGFYAVDQPDAGPHEYCYLTAGTFVGWNHDYPPTYHEVLHVLSAELPMLAEAPNQTYVPQLTSFEEPPLETPPLMARAMLVPCTIINDIQYSGNLHWRIANSPLYRLERQVFYKRLYHNHNTSTQPQTNSVTIISGVTTTESQRFWNETSVSITVEAGVSIQAFSGKISATVSRTFGYETQTSVAELEQRQVQTSINTAPGTAAACWQKYNRYVLYRHNGTDLEPVTSWEFGIDSYVVDDYTGE